MKKEGILGLTIFIALLVGVGVFGVIFLRNYVVMSYINAYGGGWLVFGLFIIGAVVLLIITSGITLELCHIIGAKIGHYEIISVCILGLTFYKANNKWKFKFKSFDGITGETIIIPKSGKTQKAAMFCLLPSIVLGLELGVYFLLYSLLFNTKDGTAINIGNDFGAAFLTMTVVGAALFIYNIIPLHLDTMTDGYRLRLSSGKNLASFNELLLKEANVENIVVTNQEKEDKPINQFHKDDDLNNVYTALSKKEYEEAIKILDEKVLNNDKLSSKLFTAFTAEKFAAQILLLPEIQARAYIDEHISIEIRRTLGESQLFECVRAYILIEGVYDRSYSEVQRAVSKTKKALKAVPSNVLNLEKQLYNDSIDYIKDIHPKWDVEQFKL